MTTETTQSVSEPIPARRRLGPQVSVGLVLSAGAFLFGAFMALPAVLVLIPKLRRFWPAALALFIGVLGVRGLTLAGVNPVLALARDQAVSQLSETLGGEVSYDDFYGEATTGEMHFDGLRVELPEINGSVSIESVHIQAGMFLFYRPDGYVIHGDVLRVRADASGGKLETFLEGLESPGGTPAEVTIDGGSVEVFGSPTTATFDIGSLRAASGPGGWAINVGLKRAVVNILDRPVELALQGGLSIGDDGSGFRVEADLRARDKEVGSGILRGTLKPGAESGMLCTLDEVQLNPLWARWRKVDTYDGLLRGQVGISGDLNHLVFDLRCRIEDYSYYHYTAMQLDPEHSFKLPLGELAGRIELTGGETWTFRNLTLTAPEATLATGKKMNAMGSGELTLNGVVPELSGTLKATVSQGEINVPISWNPLEKDSLSDVQPNIVLVAEQFGKIDLEWEVDVQKLAVNSHPLSGTLTGKLAGTFNKETGKRVGKLRAGGELEMKDGRVECLGLDGEFAGRLIFNPNAPTYHATLRGTLTASLGETPVNCEINGDLMHPGLVFTGAGLSPPALGRKIYRYSEAELTPAEIVRRKEECNRIFGWEAAANENPFLAKNSGKVSIKFQ
ncbi:MAG: hypothetical protein R3E76_11200 [Planctomycetota bacterium]